MAHTPGPWKISHDAHEPYWNIDMPMQDGSPGYGYCNAMVYTTEADARLIAAAPELLAALKEAYDALDYAQAQVDSDTDRWHLTRCRRKIKPVIDRAEGRG